ncbi:hypothetical protein MTBUT4_260064 [Magnetospirillum sp. UT-4]|nr:hypothetical protein MTBUT4_260064 [Magnetospirillum sp. UT-4]
MPVFSAAFDDIRKNQDKSCGLLSERMASLQASLRAAFMSSPAFIFHSLSDIFQMQPIAFDGCIKAACAVTQATRQPNCKLTVHVVAKVHLQTH